MKCQYTTANGRIKFEFERTSVKEVFSSLAMIQENFEPDTCCGACGGTDLKFVVRHAESKDHKKCDYFELQCAKQECKARLSFGQHQQGGTLFAKRKDKDNNWLPNGGWTIYRAGDQQQQSDYQQPPQQGYPPPQQGYPQQGGYQPPPQQAYQPPPQQPMAPPPPMGNEIPF